MYKVWCCEFNRLPNGELDDHLDPEIVQQTFDDMLTRMSSLDNKGFEGVFFAEHHFLKTLMPAPNLIIAALAQRTQQLKLGVLGNVLPFFQPWRLAEELGVLDYLTGGRLEIGVASGVPFEYDYVNIDAADVRPMYAEVLDILDLASKSEYVTYEGKYYQYSGVPVMPRLRPEVRSRKWMTLYSIATAQNAAVRGYNICSAYQSVENARKVTDAYFAKGEEIGVALSEDNVGIRRQVNICATDAEAEERHPALLARARQLSAEIFQAALARHDAAQGKEVDEGVKQTGIVDAASPTQQGLKVPTDNLVSFEDEYVFGSPETVAEKIIHQCRGIGANHFIAYHSPALDRPAVKALYDEHWPKVIEILAKANVKHTAAVA
jgi:alkanesulfonate monooxygenase SsuD/methylene tetrahydromethanopterin reductase-like flavin-dependent oxidoreductase (luciferase family)